MGSSHLQYSFLLPVLDKVNTKSCAKDQDDKANDDNDTSQISQPDDYLALLQRVSQHDSRGQGRRIPAPIDKLNNNKVAAFRV